MSVKILIGDVRERLKEMADESVHCCVTSPPYWGLRDYGTVLDPFGGAGTTGLVADRLQRNAILIELNPTYAEIARKRIYGDSPLFTEVA